MNKNYKKNIFAFVVVLLLSFTLQVFLGFGNLVFAAPVAPDKTPAGKYCTNKGYSKKPKVGQSLGNADFDRCMKTFNHGLATGTCMGRYAHKATSKGDKGSVYDQCMAGVAEKNRSKESSSSESGSSGSTSSGSGSSSESGSSSGGSSSGSTSSGSGSGSTPEKKLPELEETNIRSDGKVGQITKPGNIEGFTGEKIVGGILNAVYTIVGSIAVLIIVVCGIMIITADGDSQKVATARRGIIYALIGLLIVVSAFIITGVIQNLAGAT